VSADDEREPLRVGRRLEDRYVIEGLLGRGGMGVVLRARDLVAGRAVAIKVVREGDPSRVERFRREGRVMASLRHPGLLAVHSAGVCEVGPYLVCDLVVGARALDEAWVGVPRLQRVAWVRDAARALGVAHAQGIVHRDVKPQNLLVDEAGRLCVTDFGLAVERDVTRLTQAGGLVGTIGYMAPEQVVAHPRGITPATDVWALGVVLHEALTDEPLFAGGSPIEVLSKVCRVDVPAPGSLVPGVPPALDALCLRALARDPEARFQDGEAMARELDAWLEGRSVAPPVRRRRARRGVLVGAAIALAAVVAAVAIARRPAAGESPAALAADALAALGAARPLADDGAPIEALAARLAALRDDAPTRDGALARARVTALVGLARLARGDLDGAVAAEADLGAADDAAVQALRGALAALTPGGEPERARLLLGRAIAGGVARPELRRWRAHAVGRAGLATPADASAVLEDLDLALAAGLAEAGDLRARAFLRRGDLAGAWSAVTALGADAAPLRWEVAVARARAAFDRDALAEAVDALAAERPPGACGPAADTLRARALARAERAVGLLAAERLDPPGVREALDLVRLAHLADPARPFPRPVVSDLLSYATSVRRSDIDHEAALVVARIAPDDAEVQRAVALFVARLRDVHRGQFVPVVERALASCGEGEGALRETLEVHLCRLLSLDAVTFDECAALAATLLARLTDPIARGEVLFARADGRRRAGRSSAEALADVDQALALELADSSALILLRARLLLDLGRHDEALAEGQRFMDHAHVEVGRALEFANAICWSAGRASGDLEAARRSVARVLVHNPALGGWRVRLAWLERALGDPTAPATLRAAAPALLEDPSPAVRALADGAVSAADALTAGDAGAPAALDALVERLEALRRHEPWP
jgi:serine/threonine-protein kinase